MSSKSKLLAAAVSAVAILGITACSETLDSDRLEEELQSQIAARIGEDPGAVEVSCPDGIELSEGDTFECEAVIEGESETVLVTQEDDEGSVTWELLSDAEGEEAPEADQDAPADDGDNGDEADDSEDADDAEDAPEGDDVGDEPEQDQTEGA